MTRRGLSKVLDVLVAVGLLCCLLWDLNAYYVRLPLPPSVFWFAALPFAVVFYSLSFPYLVWRAFR